MMRSKNAFILAFNFNFLPLSSERFTQSSISYSNFVNFVASLFLCVIFYYFTTSTQKPFVLAKNVLSYMASHCNPGK